MNTTMSLMLHWARDIRRKQIEYADGHGYDLEVVGISWPPLHNDENLLSRWIEEYKGDLKGFSNRLSFHGPIADVVPHSEDLAIKEIAFRRVKRSIEIALDFNSTRIVFHTGINPVITDPEYSEHVIKMQAEFWSKILSEYKDIFVCIENMWEYDSRIFQRLKAECNQNRLLFCFDTGHFNVYSKQKITDWFSKVGDSTVHFHLHDNSGDWDRHLPIGDGTFNWKVFLSETKKIRKTYVLFSRI